MRQLIRTTEEIKAEAEALDTLKDRIPQVSKTGDNNRGAIEAQIEYLRKTSTSLVPEVLDLEALANEYGTTEEDAYDSKEYPNYLRENVLDAYNWLVDTGAPKQSEEWAVIARPE